LQPIAPKQARWGPGDSHANRQTLILLVGQFFKLTRY